MKTLKGWEKSGKDLDDYLKPLDRIDWFLYEHILCAYTAPNYQDGKGFGQNSECQFSENGIRYYSTVMQKDDKYYYLGNLPSFEPTVYYRHQAEEYRYPEH